MKINSDFSVRATAHSAKMEWQPSPMLGVFRRPLDRVGNEVARATTVVKYQPNSKFSPHVHTGGEEFIVLEGVFQDEHGDYPAGSYIRNPPQSSHTPGSESGCVILVKLWQFSPEDRTHVRLTTDSMPALKRQEGNQDVSYIPLYGDENEDVSIQHWAPNATIELAAKNGYEIFVLSGRFSESGEVFEEHSWLRLPVGSSLNVLVGENGAKVWIKQDHLKYVDSQIARVEQAV